MGSRRFAFAPAALTAASLAAAGCAGVRGADPAAAAAEDPRSAATTEPSAPEADPGTGVVVLEFPAPDPWDGLDPAGAAQWVVSCIRDPDGSERALRTEDDRLAWLDLLILEVYRDRNRRISAGGAVRFEGLAPGTYSVVACRTPRAPRPMAPCVGPHEVPRWNGGADVFGERVVVPPEGGELRITWRAMTFPLTPRTPLRII
ncbi:MAG: hypothetical protein HMLKMBBP_01296 [Planctomycetes bacterium]|nr:hypothetical protein [Planctomycetota bacterium]